MCRPSVEKATSDIQSGSIDHRSARGYPPSPRRSTSAMLEPGEYVRRACRSYLDRFGRVWITSSSRGSGKGLKDGDRFDVRIRALATRLSRRGQLVAPKANMRAGGPRVYRRFDLRTFSIRAYPVQPVPELRPGRALSRLAATQ